MPADEDIRWLQSWYAGQCNGEWEHTRGVTIESLDNPGWMLVVDLAETHLAGAQFEPVKVRNGDEDWMEYEIVDGQFRGAGDPSKLAPLIAAFRAFAVNFGGTGNPPHR